MTAERLRGVVDAEDLGRTVVAFRGGSPIRLENVAEVKVGHPPPIGDAIVNDVPGLLLIVEKQPWGNTLDVTHAIEDALEDMKPGLTNGQAAIRAIPTWPPPTGWWNTGRPA